MAIHSSWEGSMTLSMWQDIVFPPEKMEEIIAQHPDVAECAVFGVHDSLKGQLPLGLVY